MDDVLRARPAVRLACVGHAALGHVFDIDQFPLQPTKTLAHGYQRMGGGMAFNAAVAAARLGAQVRLVARVGADAAADYLREQLRAEGIDDTAVETVPGSATSVSAIVVDRSGTRQIYNHRGDALTHAHALDPTLLRGMDVLLVDPRWVAGALAALDWARQQNLLSVLDADVAPREDLLLLVPRARWVVFSEPGLQAYAPDCDACAGLERALAAGCEVAMVTRGERSVFWQRRGGPQRQHLPPVVQALDTTGAGDVFHGALAVALARGQDDEAAVVFACAAAALKCAAGQGVFGAPDAALVAGFLAQLDAQQVAAR